MNDSLRFNINSIESMIASSTPTLINSDSTSLPRKKRRFKIFESRPQTEIDEESTNPKIIIGKIETKQSKIPQKSAWIKIPKKEYEQKEFTAEQQDMEIVLLQPGFHGINTAGSETFGVAYDMNDTVQQLQFLMVPSMVMRGSQLVVNQTSTLFQSVQELKSSFHGISCDVAGLTASVAELSSSIEILTCKTATDQLQSLERFLEEVQQQKNKYDLLLLSLDQRLETLQLQQNIRSRALEESEKGQELKVFIEEKGFRVDLQEEEEDQFVQSQFLPASLLAEFIEQRRIREQQKLRNSRKVHEEKIVDIVYQMFHKVLQVTKQECSQLMGFIWVEFPEQSKEKLNLNLVFRRSTVDLDAEPIGDKQSLQYRERLLFILRNSMGKRIGGFISNYLIEGESRQDPHAFLFTLNPTNKFKVKEQSEFAYEASKHYIVCFGSDLMLSSDCMEEESYCEWPSAYHGHTNDLALSSEPESSMTWFAGDFSFMIEHIEIYQISFQ